MIIHSHLNDLPELNDLYDTLETEDDFTGTHYHEDFLETIDIFIDEYVTHIFWSIKKRISKIVLRKQYIHKF